MTISDPVLLGVISFVGVGFASTIGAIVALRRGNQDGASAWMQSMTNEVVSVRRSYDTCEERMDALGIKMQALQLDILTCIEARNELRSQVAGLTREIALLRRQIEH